MSARSVHVEVRPIALKRGNPQLERPPSLRQHWVRLVGGNGEVEWSTEPFSTRSNARRAAETHAAVYSVPVWEFGPDGKRIR